MRMFKFEVYVIDFENQGLGDLIEEVQNLGRYASFKVMNHEIAEIGQWYDNHELNQRSSNIETYRKYFKPA